MSRAAHHCSWGAHLKRNKTWLLSSALRLKIYDRRVIWAISLHRAGSRAGEGWEPRAPLSACTSCHWQPIRLWKGHANVTFYYHKGNLVLTSEFESDRYAVSSASHLPPFTHHGAALHFLHMHLLTIISLLSSMWGTKTSLYPGKTD